MEDPYPIRLRQPIKEDGLKVWNLVRESPPLDLNSIYNYYLLCSHFAATSVVGEDGSGRIVSFLSAYLRPDASDTLFVWQVVVDKQARGKGVARRMIDTLLARPFLSQISYIESTNDASKGLFYKTAKGLGAPVSETEFLSREAFGRGEHEAEVLLRVGPIMGTH